MRICSILATIGIFLLPEMSMAYEEPPYQLLEQQDEYEVRRYEPYLVAEVEVEGEFGKGGNQAF